LKTWELQSRREIKKARKQAGTQNTRSIGELPGRAVGEGEIGDVVEEQSTGEVQRMRKVLIRVQVREGRRS